MHYRKEEYEFYNHRDMQLLLRQRPYLINPTFKICGEELELCHNGSLKVWDLLAIDEVFIYLIELKVNIIERKDLIRMELIADKIKSYKPVKILLVTPVITARKKKNISNYKRIEHIEIKEIKHNRNMFKVTNRKDVQVENPEFKMFKSLQYMEYNYFDYYRGYEIIENYYKEFGILENYYICLKFKFNNNLGIILRYHLQSDYFDYEIIKYVTQTYTETLKVFCEIYYMKFNIIFDKVLSYVDIKSTDLEKLIEGLGKIDKMRNHDVKSYEKE
ncbi:hypothetical protein [Clostridium tagluense]|uniref:hypothetical protein n=1 Tax=Clostridium tagluense TaxID=360422 RepID=UPI001C0D4F27|nr:hypothetical protein [Clostridium tagluense]MBU3126044.1 hypothetical protein [Clostridium tagluense]